MDPPKTNSSLSMRLNCDKILDLRLRRSLDDKAVAGAGLSAYFARTLCFSLNLPLSPLRRARSPAESNYA